MCHDYVSFLIMPSLSLELLTPLVYTELVFFPPLICLSVLSFGLPRWCSGKESAGLGRRHKRGGFDPWVGKMPWRKKWQPTPVFLPGKSNGQRNLVGSSPWGHKELDMTE